MGAGAPMRIFLATLLANLGGAVANPPIGSQSAFVHLFEWSWTDIAKECEEFLGPKGFRAVQVSPPQEHAQGLQWYMRYQPVTYNLTSRSGNEEAFKDMVTRCKKVNVDIYVDAVINHVASGSGVGIAGSPFGHRTTAIYAQEDFHHNPGDLSTGCSITSYYDKFQVQYCDLEALPDLCTSCPRVQTLVSQYMTNLMQMGVAGFRIDAAKHQDAGELKQLLEQVQGGIPWLFGEVIYGAGEAVTPEMYLDLGLVTEFRYARQLAPNILAEGKLQYLKTFGESWGFLPGGSAVVFMDNHDTQRGDATLTYKNGALYTLANVFMLAHSYGYPKVMSSYNFDSHDQGPPDVPVHGTGGLACFNGAWVCEHRYPEIANMVAWRQAAGTGAPEAFLSSDDGNGAFFCRSSSACVALNRGSGSWLVKVKTTLPAGQYYDVLRAINVSACPFVRVEADGSAQLLVPSTSAVAFHVNARSPTTADTGLHGALRALQIIGISAVVLLVAFSLFFAPRLLRRLRAGAARTASVGEAQVVELSPQSTRRDELLPS
eukprot:s325_g2.t3